MLNKVFKLSVFLKLSKLSSMVVLEAWGGGGATGFLFSVVIAKQAMEFSQVLASNYNYCNRRNFRRGLIFVNFRSTKNTKIYSAHAHCMP